MGRIRREGVGEGVPRALHFHPPSQGHQEIPSTMDKPRRATYRLSQNTETRSKKETATVWEGGSLWGLVAGGEVGMGLAFFIMSLLVRFDFFNYVHVLH